MDNPSLKKHMIKSLSAITMQSKYGLNNNNVNLLTPSGIITGKLIRNEDNDPTNIFRELVGTISSSFLNEYSDGETISENDGFIMLSNSVLITSNSTCYNLGDLIVFYDQIIGVTIGTLKHD